MDEGVREGGYRRGLRSWRGHEHARCPSAAGHCDPAPGEASGAPPPHHHPPRRSRASGSAPIFGLAARCRRERPGVQRRTAPRAAYPAPRDGRHPQPRCPCLRWWMKVAVLEPAPHWLAASTCFTGTGLGVAERVHCRPRSAVCRRAVDLATGLEDCAWGPVGSRDSRGFGMRRGPAQGRRPRASFGGGPRSERTACRSDTCRRRPRVSS